jgi:hypothetical protein
MGFGVKGIFSSGASSDKEFRMLQASFDIVGQGPISFSAPIQSKKNTGETHDAFEERTWKERLHVNGDGSVFIPPSALKNCLAEVAKYLGETVPGKGKATYTKHFEAGLLVTAPIELGVKKDAVAGERLFVPASGKRGDGKRVWKTFPFITNWRGAGSVYLLDPVLIDKPEKVLEFLKHAGQFIGLGRFRPRNNGFYGRFKIENWKVSKVASA